MTPAFPSTLEECLELAESPPLTEIVIGGTSYPTGIIFKSQWATLKECGQRIVDGTATADDRWPYRALCYLLQAGDPKFDLHSLRDIRQEHVIAAWREIARQIIIAQMMPSAMAGSA